MIDKFLKYLSLHGVSSKSLKYYKSDLVNFLTWAKERKPSQSLIQEYIETIRLTTPTSTLNRRLSTLRSYGTFMGFKQTARSWQDSILLKFEHKPNFKFFLNKLFFSRPNWYRRYHSYPLASYIHIAILILFSSISGYAVYDQVFYSTSRLLAYPTALERPNRFLSFQGRLTDNLGNPKTVATNLVFKLYSVSTGGASLWDSGTCSITPDQDGIFSTLLGSSCGAEIASSVFSENADIWLGVTVATDAEATPRIQIATVAYALNSETLQGFPAGTGTSTIPYIDSSGVLVMASASPKIQSTSGTFAVEGVALTLTTPNTSNGIITINPDGTGTLNLTFEGAAAGASANGFVNATNANITSGALYGGTVASAATGYNFIDFQSGVTPASVFSVQNDGDIVTAGDLTLSGGNLNTGNIALTIGDATTDSITLTTDGTGNGEVVLPNDSIGTDEVQSTGQTDEYCLTYETGDAWEWQSCSSSSLWSGLGNPTGDLTLTMAAYNTTFNWDPGDNSAETAFSLTFDGQDTAADEDQVLLSLSQINNATDSVEAADALLTFANNDANDPVENAIRFDAGGAATADFTYGINFDAASFGTAELILSNAETISNLVDGTIALTAPTVTTSSALTVAGTLTANGIVNLGDGGDAITISGSDTNIAIIDGSTVNIDGDGSPTADLIQIGSGDVSATAGVDALQITFDSANASGNAIDITLSPLTGDGSDTTIAIDVDAFSYTSSAGTDIVQGLNIGTLTESGTITSTAINLGSGWDTLIGGTTTTTNLFSFTNATLTSAGNLSLAGTTGLTFSSTGGIVLTGGTISDSTDEVDINDDLAVSGILQVGGTSALTYSRFGTGTTGHAGNISAASDVLLQDLEVDGTLFLDGGTIANSAGTAAVILSSAPTTTANTLSASNWLVENTANVGQAALIVNQTKSGELFTASASGVTKFTIQNDGDVVLTNGQLRLGNLSSAPTAEGAGSMFFNTTTSTNQCYNGTNWFNCGGTLYSNNNTSVADGSYLTVTHNLATNDLLSSAWINAQGVWKSLESSYQPAIAWEGKDTSRGNYHDQVNTYKPSEETNIYTENLLQSGLLFDTLEDSTKTDSANTTASTTQQMGDDGSANYMTLADRVQAGRTGLMGGQTYATSTTDNDGQTYLSSNTVNDIYYYDRTRDSVPEVLVELGIDPNWYNGVTLSVATSSAQYSQNGTIADKNPNLTPSYNGSLIKATGTDTTPRTIYITIKTPTTFDWTNYQGDEAAAVTITPGTAQTLGSTGVSVTFSAVNYNVGDVFKVASWFIEAESATRGARQQFPERSNVIVNGNYTHIIDSDTQKMWMSTEQVSWKGSLSPDAVTMLNGMLYIAANNSGSTDGNMRVLNFATDDDKYVYETSTYHATGADTAISARNTAGSSNVIIAPIGIVTRYANDVTTAVIPNQTTQEMTVSGWGYIVGDATTIVEEDVLLPYKFNQIPNITVSYAAYTTTTAPTSLESCVNRADAASGIEAFPGTITKNKFQMSFSRSTGTFAATDYHCYTWTATGTVSPKQFLAVATGATSADGGTTIINETDGTKIDIMVGSQHGDVIWQTKIALADNELYTTSNDSTANNNNIVSYRGVHGLSSSETSVAQYSSGRYRIADQNVQWSINGPTILGTATGTEQVKSLMVTSNTSTISPNSNTIYVGTTSGASVIQEKQGTGNLTDSQEENGGSVKYYTKDYISEEMVGDVRGMWPLNNSNASSDFEDNSIKAETLTGTNITAAGDSVSGVRNTATDFDGSTEYMSCTDAACGGTTELDYTGSGGWSFGAWVKQTSTTGTQVIMSKVNTDQLAYSLSINSGTINVNATNTASAWDAQRISTIVPTAGQWYHLVAVYNPSTNIDIYVNGQLTNSALTGSIPATIRNTTSDFSIGGGIATNYFNGSIDEPFVTATALTAGQIKNMYQVGARALQSHSTSLGSSTADSQQQLGYISTGTSSVGVVQPDWNNQFMYVGTNSTTLGALSKIQLNSDTNIKTYNSSANVPTGGPLLIDEDVTSLGVGYTLETVGSAASGVKSMGVDNNATATSGNFVSKTYALPKNIGSAVLWVSPIIDASDGSNTLTVKASNDSGSNYVTCTLVNTNSSPSVPEKEYACTFSTADNDLKVKFEFVRGSTKTNTYVAQYGISWLGETGFRVEQADTNNVRLYNFSGETQNLKLNVTGASTAALANPWTDGGSYLYATGYEALRIYDGSGVNYLGLSHDGTLANLTYSGTTILSINSTGDLLPNTDDTQSLGSDTKRWKDIFLGPGTVHIGTSTTDEGTISYNTASNILDFDTDTTTNADIAFFSSALYIDKSTGNVGVGTGGPGNKFTVLAGSTAASGTTYGVYFSGAQSVANVGTFGGLGLGPSYTAASGNTLANLYGLRSFPSNSSTGTITSQYGGSFAPDNISSGVVTDMFGVHSVPTKSGTGAVTSAYGLYSRVDNTNASGAITNGYGLYIADSTETGAITNDWGLYQVDTGASNYFGGSMGIGQTPNATQKLIVTGDTANGYSSYFFNDGNNANRYGIGIQNGADDNSGSNIHVLFFDGDGTETGRITSTTGAVTYGAFTANHDTSIPEDFNETGYPYGTLLCIDEAHANSDPSRQRNIQYQSSVCDNGPYDSKVLGVYASKYDDQENLHQVYVLGDGQILVNGEGGDINIGDSITTSSTPGVGMRATEYGTTIGRAQEDYHFANPSETKLVAVQYGLGYNIPNMALAGNGDVILTGDSENNYEVSDSTGVINRISGFAKVVAANIQAGIGTFGQVETKVISPIANSDLIIDLTPEQSEASRLVIRGVNEAEVASIDAGGNADFAGSVETEKLVVNSDATISGTLYANNIESERLSEIEDLLRDVETNQQLLTEAGNWNSNTATESGTFTDLIASSIQTTDLYVTGQAALTSLFVTDNLTAGKIDSLDTPLQIQSLAATPLEIMAGKITVDTDGNTKFLGNVEIAGNLKINNIIVANNIDPMATESATLVEGEVNSNSTAGKAVLTANSEKVRINNNKVSLNTLIYITPITSTQNKVLYVKAKDEGYFEVGFSDTLDTDVEFNWWIIELQ